MSKPDVTFVNTMTVQGFLNGMVNRSFTTARFTAVSTPDGVVVDTWAGWQLNSDAFCPNAAAGLCGKMGNGGRVGVAFKY